MSAEKENSLVEKTSPGSSPIQRFDTGHHSARSSATLSEDGEYASDYEYYEDGNVFTRFIDSFKPINLEDDGVDTSHMNAIERSVYATARHPLARRLKGRHLQMIAIGGSIGTGLFVGSGSALSQGGPAGQLISYVLVGYSLLCVVNALGEMSVQYPVLGSFNAFFSRFVDPSWGFTVGLLYSLSWLISFPSELVALSLTVGYWNDSINPAVWVAIFYVVICSINMFGVKGYGEVEFFLSIIKVIAVIGFLIFGLCMICGAGNQGYIGGQYWTHPGAFNHGFKGVCSTFILAAFTFGGVELVALAASETKNPRKSLPRATKQVFWRISLFYLLTAVIIGCLVPYDDERLLNATSNISQSPFVIAIQNGGVKVLSHIMNAVILVAVVSVGNSSVYGCSRSLASLAVQGLIPRQIGYIDRAGRPLVAILITCVFGLLGFLAADPDKQSEVFTWFFSVCSLAAFFTWIAICYTHVRFRLALKAQGRSLDEVIFVSPLGIWGSISGMVILALIVVCEIWVSIWPIGSPADVETFWQDCLSLPLMLLLWAGHKTLNRTWGQLQISLVDIDLDTGRREMDVEVIKQEIAEEKARINARPFWYRFYRVWC